MCAVTLHLSTEEPNLFNYSMDYVMCYEIH
jgi:hypothetical protein